MTRRMTQIIDKEEQLLAHGQAALTLVESVLLVLVETGIVSTEEMLEAVETVISSKRALADNEEDRAISTAAIGLLIGIANSLRAARSDGS